MMKTSDNTMTSPESWDIVIRPKRHLLDIDLKELWDHRDLLMMLVRRDMEKVGKNLSWNNLILDYIFLL